MPSYVVRYVTETGAKKKEVFFAPDMVYLRGVLQRKNYWPLSIEVQEGGFRKYKTRLSAGDTISILDQVEIQLQVSINVDDAFRNLAEEVQTKKVKFVVSRISDSIDSNGRVADACGQFPNIFPDHIRQMISVGEDTGKLAPSFTRVIEYFKAADTLMGTIKNASIYPSLVLGAMMVFVFVVFGFTVPKLMVVFEELNVELSAMTKFLLAISIIVRDYPLIVGLVMISIPISLFLAFRTKQFRPVIDWILAKAPVIGPITKDVCISRFAANLGALYTSEIPIVQGLIICSRIAGNAVYDKAIAITRQAVEEGRKIADGLKESKMFPGMVVLTVKIGEENGRLADSLQKVADYYSRKAQEKVERALKLFEPLMLIVLVVMVGFIAVAMLSPMFTMIEQMSQGR